MLSWLGGLIGLPALAGVAQSLINFLTATVGPAFSKGLDLVSWVLATLWEGFKDIMDNAATVFTVIVLCVGTWLYGKVPAEIKTHKCEKQIVYIQKQCPKAKTIYKERPSAPSQEFRFPWEAQG